MPPCMHERGGHGGGRPHSVEERRGSARLRVQRVAAEAVFLIVLAPVVAQEAAAPTAAPPPTAAAPPAAPQAAKPPDDQIDAAFGLRWFDSKSEVESRMKCVQLFMLNLLISIPECRLRTSDFGPTT